MDIMERRQAEQALVDLEKANANADQLVQRVMNHIEDTADRYANKQSQVLVGIVGGVLGSALGVFVAHYAGNPSVWGPLGMMLGASSGILMWRGKGHRSADNATYRADVGWDALESRMAKLRALPPSPEVDDAIRELCKCHKNMTARYGEIITRDMDR